MITRKQTVKKYTVTAGVLTYNIPFPIYESGDVLAVWSADENGLDEYTLTLGSDYGVTINSAGDGGTVTLKPDRVPIGATLAIVSNIPETQELDLSHTAEVDTESTEKELDRQVQMIQQLSDKIARCIKVNITDSRTPDDYMRDFWEAVAAVLKALGIVEDAHEYVQKFVAGIPILKPNLSEVENSGVDGLFWVPGFGDCGDRGDDISNRVVVADGTRKPRPLGERFADIINVKDFGAKGDGVTDDTEAWIKFKAATGGIKYIPEGHYLIDGEVRYFPVGCIGNADAEKFDVSRWSQTVDKGNVINIGREWIPIDLNDCKNIAPIVAIENKIDTSNVSGYDNRAVCAYLTHTQEGNNEENRLFSTTLILGAENKAAGDNDVICFSSRAQRYDVPGGVGDTAGTGGRIDTYSHQKGCAMGAEFASHVIDCGIPRPSDYGNVSTSKWVTPLHITGDSTGSPATAAILIQGKSGYNPFFDGIQFSYSMFKFAKNATFLINEIPNNDGTVNPSYPGEYVTTDENGHLDGTVALNMGSFSEANGYPDVGIKFGHCKEHIAIPSGKMMNNLMTSMRIHSKSGAGLRLDADKNDNDNYLSCYLGFYNDRILKGRIEYIPTNQSINIVNDAQGSGLTLTGTSFRPTTNGTLALGGPDNKFSEVYAQTGNINTSDERKKQSISNIPDRVLDAWGEVGFYEFRFNDSVERKGEKARFHTGLIAQRIKAVFEKYSIDPFKYGLLCYDSWEEKPDVYIEYDEKIPAEYDENNNIIVDMRIVHHKKLVEKGITAGELYSVRYDEALCLEAAYQRRELERLKARIESLESQMR